MNFFVLFNYILFRDQEYLRGLSRNEDPQLNWS